MTVYKLLAVFGAYSDGESLDPVVSNPNHDLHAKHEACFQHFVAGASASIRFNETRAT
jgi:hypothetical protein